MIWLVLFIGALGISALSFAAGYAWRKP